MEKAKGQELLILTFFVKHKGELFTPSEVQDRLEEPSILTSIRRAMTNLTKRGFLEKTDIKRQGKFGRPNFCWRLKEVRK